MSIIKKLSALLLILLFIPTGPIAAQTVIQMEKEDGVYKIPCKVNGLRLKLIFDTGASTVSISSSVASMMLDNDYLDLSDIKGTGTSQIANGELIDHTRINLKEIEIGGLKLKNVEAVVIHQQSAPLLLGLSAISRLGKISINGNQLTITSATAPIKKEVKQYSQEELLRMKTEAYQLCQYNTIAALEKFEILDANKSLDPSDIVPYAICLSNSDRHEEAFEKFLSIEEWTKQNDKYNLADLYVELCMESYYLNDFNTAIKYGGLCQINTTAIDKERCSVTPWIAWSYQGLGDIFRAELTCKQYLESYFSALDISATDCWDKGYRDNYVANIYNVMAGLFKTYAEGEKYFLAAAAWGNDDAIEICNKFNWNYTKRPYEYRY